MVELRVFQLTLHKFDVSCLGGQNGLFRGTLWSEFLRNIGGVYVTDV